MFASWGNIFRTVAIAILATLAASADARSDSTVSDSYWVTVREIDGDSSVPAHLVCRPNRRCSGEMSVSTDKGYLRVFVIAMIDGAEALVRFRGDGENVACVHRDYTRIPLERPPRAVYAIAYLCDAPRPEPPDPSAEPPVLRNLPHLAALRIDVRARVAD